jgi:urease accessory protein
MKHFLSLRFLSSLFLLIVALPTLAQAHTETGSGNGFTHGFQHPLLGADHLLAMLAVGLWAAQSGGRALWVIPLAFVSIMSLGGALGMAGVPLPLTEAGILGSILVLGVLIAAGIRLPLALGSLLVGLFALCHGHAHGSEMPGDVSGLAYGLGFVLTTLLLHLSGIGAGLVLQRGSHPVTLRVTGIALISCALWLSFF